jgi:hypothetical protein
MFMVELRNISKVGSQANAALPADICACGEILASSWEKPIHPRRYSRDLAEIVSYYRRIHLQQHS